MEPRKRKRTTSNFWSEASTYIKDQGGAISSSIDFRESTRTVILTSNASHGESIMCIPPDALISLNTVEQSPIGATLFKLVHEVEDSKLFHSKNDVVLALFLACVSHLNDVQGKDEDADDLAYEGVHKYLATLPENDSYDNIPRRWSMKKLYTLLGGTSVLDRVMDEKQGLENDYMLLKESHVQAKENDSIFLFPSLKTFDQMIAVVGSRAFQSLGEDGIDCMIPLLDCINHKRGVGEKNDVTYSKGKDGSIHLIANHELEKDSIPSITYGAKGNAQLLTRYSFTLENNIEPDGSSNDTIELKILGQKCEFRAGPKSYTYGCLVKALSLTSESNQAHEVEEDAPLCGMDDFLNACEEEGEAFDGMYGGMEIGGDADEKNDENEIDESIETEIHGLQYLGNELKEAKKRYNLSGDSLVNALSSPLDSSEYFSAILVKSEIRALTLYIDTIQLIMSKLKGEIYAVKATTETNKDCGLLHQQAIELCEAYIAIRHP